MYDIRCQMSDRVRVKTPHCNSIQIPVKLNRGLEFHCFTVAQLNLEIVAEIWSVCSSFGE